MNISQARKAKLFDAISIYDKDPYIVWEALKRLAQNEYFSGCTKNALWYKAVAMEMDGDEKLYPAVSKDLVAYTSILEHPMHPVVLDTYCSFRGMEIFFETRKHGDAKLKEEVERVKQIQKLYAKPNPTRRLKKYVLALLFVSLIAMVLKQNGV